MIKNNKPDNIYVYNTYQSAYRTFTQEQGVFQKILVEVRRISWLNQKYNKPSNMLLKIQTRCDNIAIGIEEVESKKPQIK